MLTRSDPSARPSIPSLVERGDVHGLINRLYHPEQSAPKEYEPDMAPGLRGLFDSLDQKIGPYWEDRHEACDGLRALGERAVPALIDELGTKDRHVGACVAMTLQAIGSPALPALVEVIGNGPEDRVILAGLTIGEMRKGGAQLPPDIVRTLVTIKMSPPVGFSLARQEAAAQALGPLDAQSIPDWVGLLEQANALRAGARPAERAPAAKATETCKRCGRPIASGDYTCPHCGNTRWGVIVVWAMGSLVCLGAAILWAPHIAGVWGSVVLWGGWILGLLFLLVTVTEAVKGLRTPNRPLPESAAGAAPSAAVGLPTLQAAATAAMARVESQPDPSKQQARSDGGVAPVADHGALRLRDPRARSTGLGEERRGTDTMDTRIGSSLRLADPEHRERARLDEALHIIEPHIIFEPGAGTLAARETVIGIEGMTLSIQVPEEDGDRAVSIIQEAIAARPEDADLLAARASVEQSYALYATARETWKELLARVPEHFEARMWVEHWATRPIVWTLPPWGVGSRFDSLPPIMLRRFQRGIRVQPVRDGFQRAVAVVCEVEGLAPDPATKVAVQCVLSRTPQGPVVGLYVHIDAPPEDPFNEEILLGIDKPSFDTWSNYELIRLMDLAPYCLVVFHDGGRTTLNRRVPFEGPARDRLHAIAADLAQSTSFLEPQNALAASRWHMERFHLSDLEW